MRENLCLEFFTLEQARGVTAPAALNWVSSALHCECDSLQVVPVADSQVQVQSAEGEPPTVSVATKSLQSMVLQSFHVCNPRGSNGVERGNFRYALGVC